MIKQGLIFIGILFFLTGCINIPIPIGDGNTLTVGSDGITFTDKDKNEHSLNIDEENETFSIQGVDGDGEEYNVSLDGDDGNFNLNMTGFGEDNDWVMGENLELPFDVPENVPFADDANIYQYARGENNIMVNYFTDNPFDQVDEMYSQYFNSSSFVEEAYKTEASDEEAVFKQFTSSTKMNIVSVTVIQGSHEEMINVSINVQPVNE